MKAENEDWENELWSYVNAGDGKSCPGFDSCQSLKDGLSCFNNEAQRAINRTIHLYYDIDDFDPSHAMIFPRLAVCPHRERITLLIRQLARTYLDQKWNGILPVPDNLVTASPKGIPIEVRRVPLKANHGAVWRMDDCWLIYLNSNASSARQRFTLYHEIFHILAHSNGDSNFKHTAEDVVYFNEFLADNFSSAILSPRDVLQAKWTEIKDVSKIAQLFDIPAPIMFGKLRYMKLDLSSF